MSTPPTLAWPPLQSENKFYQVWSRFQAGVKHLFQHNRSAGWLEIVSLCLAVVSLMVAVLIWIYLQPQLDQIKQPAAPVTAELQRVESATSASSSAIASPSAGPSTLTVYVTGAVHKPGVYRLSNTSLLMDAVTMAGGLTTNVWQDYIDQFINLAEPLSNYQKVWIPKLTQQTVILPPDSAGTADATLQTSSLADIPAPAANSTASPTSPDPTPATNAGTVISVNTATLNQLMELKGIGEVRAQAIIANRPYQSLDELVSKAKVPSSVFQDIVAQLKI